MNDSFTINDDERPATILTIDDEEMIRETLGGYLEDSGFQVLKAENGRIGVELFRRHKPDAVLVDLRMPEMDGLDVLKVISVEDPETPVVVVSGTGVVHDVVWALRLGAWDYIVKPIEDMAVLEHIIKKVLERASLLKENRRYREHLEDEVRKRTLELTQTNALLNREITERILSQEKLTESLKEKEVLLREIHHRVKNNLQIISSLLNLQVKNETEEKIVNLFKESQNRIRVMALIHEKLYLSENLARIDLQSYVASLLDSLVSTYKDYRRKVAVRTEIEDVTLDIDAAIPCGIIINELATNALKYAFEDRGNGEVFFSFRRDGNNFVMILADDGIGLPEGIVPEKTETLGMQLVNGLVRQLHGSLEVRVENGTRYTIAFPAR